MSIAPGKAKRRILPRWRASGKAARSADFSALKPARFAPVDVNGLVRKARLDFELEPSVGTAAEMMTAASLAGDDTTARQAALFLLDDRAATPGALASMARLIVGEEAFGHRISEQEKTSEIRRLLRINGANPMLWSDLARHFASIGRKEKAQRCMSVALSMAPDHRWMLRTAARFLVHQEDSAAAHRLLANHPKTRSDPWLLAAELACAQVAGRAPKHWGAANDLLRRRSHSPEHSSELAAAVAMLELEGGNRKGARKAVFRALEAPTENTLAQVSWAMAQQRLQDGFGLEALVQRTSDAYEADCRLRLAEGDLLGALGAAETWREDEPFAARPCAEIAFIASLIDDHERTAEMANCVSLLDGHLELNVEMNCLFSKLSSGNLSQDRDGRELDRIRGRLLEAMEQGGEAAYHAIANMGLWEYRYGNPAVGRALYDKAVDIALKLHQRDTAAMAAVFGAREAFLASDSAAPAMLARAQVLTKDARNPCCSFILLKVEALSEHAEDASTIFSPASASEFIAKVNPPRILRIEKESDRVVMVVSRKLKPPTR